MLRPEFLKEAGWDPARQLLAPPRDHPLLGLPACAVIDCEAGIRTRGAVLCTTCETRFRSAGVPLEQFVATPSGKVRRGEKLCRVPGCQRPTHSQELCARHHLEMRVVGVPVEAFLTRDDVVPMSSLGPCLVPSCIRRAAGSHRLCGPHAARWWVHRRQHPEVNPAADLVSWAQQAPPVGVDHIIILRGLPERLQLELLIALQQRTQRLRTTQLTLIRHVAKLLREHGMTTVFDLQRLDPAGLRPDIRATIDWVTTAVRRALSTPEDEQTKDVWDLSVFGASGGLDFTPLTQPWLRMAAKAWAAEDLPRHRGRQPSRSARFALLALRELSESLRLSRTDQGNVAADLGRGDIVGFANRLAHKQRTGQLSSWQRANTARAVRRFLEDVRTLGLTRPGGCLAGLPDDFALRRNDVPDEAEDPGGGRALPAAVLATIIEHLPLLEQRCSLGMRRIAELLIDTGRRPDEICQLPWDCLDRDSEGNPVLVYTDDKNNRPGRRLPISHDTAGIVAAQKADVRVRFALTPPGELVLFPRDRANPKGTLATRDPTFAGAHRIFIRQIPVPFVDDLGQEFDPRAIVPYAYRHNYAQRHADSGVPIDVLCELLGHRSLKTTQGYYRVTETRVRTAVERLGRHQFDGRGRRVLREVAQSLEVEHARTRVGQVAVPFGVCTEPSNVKAGGTACPYRYVCTGCGHFRSDPSYLPELKSHLQQLLADRERILAAVELEEWARQTAAPPSEEIARLRELIGRIEANLEGLSDDDRAQISQAVDTVRQTRQVVFLGRPTIGPPSPVRELP